LPAIAIRQPSSRERFVGLTLLGTAVLLKLPYLFHYRFNSDEAQHLHIVWGWTKGLLQYRDLFDNHTPLFHLLMAPVLAFVGERPDALVLMRFAMLPLYLLSLWLTYLLARRLFDARVALGAAVLAGVHYEFFFKSIEFRTDNMWTVAWLAALAVAAGGRLGAGRAFAAGAALGAAISISQKTVLLAAALAAAALLVAGLSAEVRAAFPARRIAALAAAAAAGFLLLPAVLTAFFAAQGALGALAYGVIGHNVLPGLGDWKEPWRLAIVPMGGAAAAWAAAPRLRAAGGDRIRVLRVFVLLTVALYVLALEGFWPLVTGQDYLPVWPLAAIFAVAGFQYWEDRRTARGRALPATVLLAVLAAELGVIVFKGPVWRDRGHAQTALLADVLRLTDGGDDVMDAKGETVFRRRPFFWVLETITKARLRRGLLPDTIPEAIVRTRCHVAVPDSARFPQRGRAFLNANFVSVGRLRVAGLFLGPAPRAGAPLPFAIAVPGEYTVVTPVGPAAGELDGTGAAGPRFLAAGTHEFKPEGASLPLAVVWAKAIARGFSPFTPRRGAP
jgi:hypothetical protein